MKIELGSNSESVLARYYAEQVHAMLIRQHLNAAREYAPFRGAVVDERIREIRAAISSIPDPLRRRGFVKYVKVLFQDLKKSHGTAHTTRDFVAGLHRREERRAA